MSKKTISFSRTNPISHRELILNLIDYGYTRSEIVSIQGEFAVRGNVIDVFGAAQHYPVRIEYDGSGIDRIATFDITTQRMLGVIPAINILDMSETKIPVTFHAMAEQASSLLSEWHIGDYLVHETFGIGQYKGLVHLDLSRHAQSQSLPHEHAPHSDWHSQILPQPQALDLSRHAQSQSLPHEHAPHSDWQSKTSPNKKNGIERANALSKKETSLRQQQENNAIGAEYIWLQYKGDDKLYIPLHQLQLISKYGAADSKPTINGLYDGRWQKTKNKTKKNINTLVEDLLNLYQNRKTQPGIAYPEDSLWQLDFENEFPHPPTNSQISATREIKSDMQQPYPMNRLLCGDVGYGKSEVILRAVFKAAEAGKQVVMLVPTTLLARQHFKLLRERFSKFPFRIEMLSRFVSAKDQTSIVSDIQKHRIDIIIGTHRVVQKDIIFADLGLIVVDEEQRFGVKDKELLTAKWPTADVLTVSATPIPRTLYMAITGARQMSSITEPPINRKPILTAIEPKKDSTLKWGIAQELDRNGQIFYVYNRVKGLSTRMHAIQKWFPKARVAMIHGQLPTNQLDTTMAAFAAHEVDILVCTSIVENGLDIPKANTIIIDDAPKMGLAQIYQLRGRVGRSSTQGYAYLLYDDKNMSDEGKQRMSALKQFVALGSGYHLAMRDLEMRGAGTMLGYQQHGSMTAIGFELYCNIIQDTLNPGAKTNHEWPTDIPLYIPESYIPEARVRLGLYHRLIRAEFAYQIADLLEECRDRFGKPPEALVTICEMRKSCLT